MTSWSAKCQPRCHIAVETQWSLLMWCWHIPFLIQIYFLCTKPYWNNEYWLQANLDWCWKSLQLQDMILRWKCVAVKLDPSECPSINLISTIFRWSRHRNVVLLAILLTLNLRTLFSWVLNENQIKLKTSWTFTLEINVLRLTIKTEIYLKEYVFYVKLWRPSIMCQAKENIGSTCIYNAVGSFMLFGVVSEQFTSCWWVNTSSPSTFYSTQHWQNSNYLPTAAGWSVISLFLPCSHLRPHY